MTADIMRQEEPTMTTHASGTRKEWLARRLELLDAEKDLTQARDLYTQSEINVLTGITGVHKAKGTLLTEFMQSL